MWRVCLRLKPWPISRANARPCSAQSSRLSRLLSLGSASELMNLHVSSGEAPTFNMVRTLAFMSLASTGSRVSAKQCALLLLAEFRLNFTLILHDVWQTFLL